MMQAYGIFLCDVHGAEVKAGILAEIHHDAGNVLEDADQEDSSMNPAAWMQLHTGQREMTRRCIEAEKAQADALLTSYPVIEERVDSETSSHDFRAPHVNEDPVGIFADARTHLHRLMRLSWSMGQDWILEVLEEEREGASAQLAFALAIRAQQTGQPV